MRTNQTPNFVFHEDLAIITPVERWYGSAELARIEQLQELVAWLSRISEVRTVVIDLSEVAVYGARLVGLLASLAQELGERGKRLIVANDRCGLLRVCGLEGTIGVYKSTRLLVEIQHRDFDLWRLSRHHRLPRHDITPHPALRALRWTSDFPIGSHR